MRADGVTAGDNAEWMKSSSLSSTSSSSGPPPPLPVQPPQLPSDADDQRQVQQIMLAMHNMPQAAASRWATPPVGHVPGMPRPAALHPGMPHAKHIGPASAESAVDHPVSLLPI